MEAERCEESLLREINVVQAQKLIHMIKEKGDEELNKLIPWLELIS